MMSDEYTIRYNADTGNDELRYGDDLRYAGTHARCEEVLAINQREDAARAAAASDNQ